MNGESNVRAVIRRATIAIACAVAANASGAAELLVRVSGISAPVGQIGCALFATKAGFPMDTAAAKAQWLSADPNGVTCRFADVGSGTYAVSVSHDVNGNRRVDTNLVGIPTEQWGVSNNVRPTLRAPRFEEASFTVPADDQAIVLDIRVEK